LKDLEDQHILQQRDFSSKAFLLWKIFAEPAFNILLVYLPYRYLYHLASWPRATSCMEQQLFISPGKI